MDQASIVDRESSKIEKAIQQFYDDAEFNPDPTVPAVVKLYDLIDAAYPIRIVELKNLTYRQAIEFLVAETKQSIPFPQNGDTVLAGFLYAKAVYGCILVNKTDPIVRRRFSVAHELGHYVLHFLPRLEEAKQNKVKAEELILTEGLIYPNKEGWTEDVPEGQLTFTRGESSNPVSDDVAQMEREANQFAAALLMPKLVCQTLVERFVPRFGSRRAVLARRLGTELLVSKAAMLWRLEDLNLP